MMLAHKWRNQDPAGWWVSEKLDGCRAFWDGECLRTRNWNRIDAPARLTASLPRGIALDGELWGGRGAFELVKVLVQWPRAKAREWGLVRFMVFDAPSIEPLTVEKRWAVAAKLARGEQVTCVKQRRCSSQAEMRKEFDRVIRGGGEGLVLRRPGHFYSFDRSSDWLKVKPRGVE